MKQVGLLLLLCIVLFGCTENQKAKEWGGNAEIRLPINTKLVNATWKGDNFWYLTRPMTANDISEIYEFKEESSFGLLQGTYTIIEFKDTIVVSQDTTKLTEGYTLKK